MKKLLVLGMVLALSTTITLAKTTYTSTLKNAVKQDIAASKQEAKNFKASTKEAIKKDIEAKTKQSQESKTKALKEKKAEKLKQIDAKITELNKKKATIQNDKQMTYTEKTVKLNAIDKQIEFHNKQKNALK